MSRFEYRPGLFVDRKQEVALILEKARRALSGPGRRERVVVINAARGSGKSWLLQEAAQQLQHEPGIRTLYLDLARYADDPPSTAVRGVIQELSNGVGLEVESPIETIATALKEARTAFVLLIDHVDESDKGFLDLLEDYVLGPVAALDNVLLILAGRGKRYVWKNLFLRPEPILLQPFGLADTVNQLKGQVPDIAFHAQVIHQLSNGYPWANYLIAREHGGVSIDVINLLLGDAASHREELEALCVLRSFREGFMSFLFARYYRDNSYLDRGYGYYRKIRESLVRSQLVEWNGNLNGWVIDGALRTVVENQLKIHSIELWGGLHCAAYVMYGQLAKDYLEAEKPYLAEMAYHRQQLAAVDRTPNDCL